MEEKRHNLTFQELLEKSLHPERYAKRLEREGRASEKNRTKTGRKLPDVSNIEGPSDTDKEYD